MAVPKEVLSEVRPGLQQGTYRPGSEITTGGPPEAAVYADFGKSEQIVHPMLLDRSGFLGLNDSGFQDQVTVSLMVDIKTATIALPYLSIDDAGKEKHAKLESEISAKKAKLAELRPDFESSPLSPYEKYVFWNLDQANNPNLKRSSRKRALERAMKHIHGDPETVGTQIAQEMKRRAGNIGYTESRGKVGDYNAARWDRDRLERARDIQIAQNEGRPLFYRSPRPEDIIVAQKLYDGPKTISPLIINDNETIYETKLAEKKWIANQPLEGLGLSRSTNYDARAEVARLGITRLSDGTDIQQVFNGGIPPREDVNIERNFGDIDPNEIIFRTPMPEESDGLELQIKPEWAKDPHLASEELPPSSDYVMALRKARDMKRKIGITVFKGGNQQNEQDLAMAETA